MTVNLRPYGSYKESGAALLGRVPSHWQVVKLKRSVQNVVDLTADRDEGERFISLQDIEGWTGGVRDIDSHRDFMGQAKKFAANDVLFGKLRPYLAKVTRLPEPGVCVGELLYGIRVIAWRPRSASVLSPERPSPTGHPGLSAEFIPAPRGRHRAISNTIHPYSVLVQRPNSDGVDSGYLELLLRSAPFIDYVNAATQGAKMPRAEWDVVGGTPIPLPPADEQGAIERYVRATNSNVDRLLRNKRRLIALLTEQKQAIIQQAVTRGMDPDVPLKPSGVEWLSRCW